jgi:hypothetical protein
MPPKKDKKTSSKKEDDEEIDRELIVRNFEFFDSDASDNEEEPLEDFDDYDGYETEDEDTMDNLDILGQLLIDVADVEVLGLKVYKINFHDTKIPKLEDKKCNCDFDYDNNDLPIMPDGGEHFIAPYLLAVSKKKKYFKGCIFETNVNQKIVL